MRWVSEMGHVEELNPIPFQEDELDGLKKSNIASPAIECRCKSKLEAAEKELQKSKESERATLEVLAAQTELFEKTTISLEETKHKNRALVESNKTLLNPKSSKKQFWSSNGRSLDLVHAQGEIKVLTRDLKSAKEADENSKVAMRGLALTLKEATAESEAANQKLADALAEMERTRAEAESLKSSLDEAEEKLRAASEECERARSELEESAAEWSEKEKGFMACIRAYEEEISRAKAETDSLFASRRAAREEALRLREMVKKAVKEAGTARESMEVAGEENARLKELVAEKGRELARLEHESEWLKLSEAAAIESVERLKTLFDAASTIKSSGASVSDSNVVDVGTAVNGAGHMSAAQPDVTERPAANRMMKEKRQLCERIKIVRKKIFLGCK